MIHADEAGVSARRTRRAFDEAKHGRMIDYFNGLVDVTSAVPATDRSHARHPSLCGSQAALPSAELRWQRRGCAMRVDVCM